MHQPRQQIAEGVDFANERAMPRVDEDIDTRVKGRRKTGRSFFSEPKGRIKVVLAYSLPQFGIVSAPVAQMQVRHGMATLSRDPVTCFARDNEHAQINSAAVQSELGHPLFSNHSLGQKQAEDEFDVSQRCIAANLETVNQDSSASNELHAKRGDKLLMVRRPPKRTDSRCRGSVQGLEKYSSTPLTPHVFTQGCEV